MSDEVVEKKTIKERLEEMSKMGDRIQTLEERIKSDIECAKCNYPVLESDEVCPKCGHNEHKKRGG